MLKTRLFVVVLGLFLSFQVSAKVLVISDIDDTLKIAHVLDLYSKVDNSIAYDNHFLGMDHVFRAMHATGKVDFAFVSNAPSWVMGVPHGLFLSYNQYPEGPAYLRPYSASAATHKVNTISKILEREKPEMVILIGDN